MTNRKLQCKWCRKSFIWSGRGRRPKYCKPSHCQRAYERRRRDPWGAALRDIGKDAWVRKALKDLEAVMALGFEAMRGERYKLGGTIEQLKHELKFAQLKHKLLMKQLKDAPKTHTQLAREMQRSVDNALSTTEL